MEHETHVRLTALLGVLSVSLVVISLTADGSILHGSSEEIGMPAPAEDTSSLVQFYFQYMMEPAYQDWATEPMPDPMMEPDPMWDMPVPYIPPIEPPYCTDPCDSTCPTFDPMGCSGMNPDPVPVPPVACVSSCDDVACPGYDPMNCPPAQSAAPDPLTLTESIINTLKQLILQLYAE